MFNVDGATWEAKHVRDTSAGELEVERPPYHLWNHLCVIGRGALEQDTKATNAQTSLKLLDFKSWISSLGEIVPAGVVFLFVLLDLVVNDTFDVIFMTKNLMLTAVTGKVKTYNFLRMTGSLPGAGPFMHVQMSTKGWRTLFSATKLGFNG